MISAIPGSAFGPLDPPEERQEPPPEGNAKLSHTEEPAAQHGSPAIEQPQPPSSWSKPDQGKVNTYINQAMAKSHGNVEQAFAYLRDLRDKPQNYYDSNLAIAADYMRARWDTQQHGAKSELEDIGGYLAAKGLNVVPKEGPGPVSPDSSLERQYMLKGVQDEVKSDPKVLAWDLPTPLGVSAGTVKNIVDQVRSWI